MGTSVRHPILNYSSSHLAERQHKSDCNSPQDVVFCQTQGKGFELAFGHKSSVALHQSIAAAIRNIHGNPSFFNIFTNLHLQKIYNVCVMTLHHSIATARRGCCNRIPWPPSLGHHLRKFQVMGKEVVKHTLKAFRLYLKLRARCKTRASLNV